jgi:hypothetical protein
MNCDVKMFLAKTKGLQKYGFKLHEQGFFHTNIEPKNFLGMF